MNINKATQADYIHIVRSVQNKKLDYITSRHVQEDIAAGRLYKIEYNGRIIAICTLYKDTTYHYNAIKRLCKFRKTDKGFHITKNFIDFFSKNFEGKLGCTPWVDNITMRYILEKKGFILEYIFNEKWCFYSRS